MRELRSRALIIVKGFLFVSIAVTAGLLILLESPTWRRAVVISLLVWASCRSYYFLFYVLEKYVDPRLRYQGLLALARRATRPR